VNASGKSVASGCRRTDPFDNVVYGVESAVIADVRHGSTGGRRVLNREGADVRSRDRQIGYGKGNSSGIIGRKATTSIADVKTFPAGLPEKRFLLAQQSVPVPQRHAPCRHFPEFLVGFSVKNEIRPMAETRMLRRRDLKFSLLRQTALRHAAKLGAQLELIGFWDPRLPLHREPQARLLLRIMPQVGLVCVPVIQAGRARVPALEVEELRQHLDHPPPAITGAGIRNTKDNHNVTSSQRMAKTYRAGRQTQCFLRSNIYLLSEGEPSGRARVGGVLTQGREGAKPQPKRMGDEKLGGFFSHEGNDTKGYAEINPR